MSTRAVLMQIEALKQIKAKKTLRKKRRDHQAFLEHMKTCKACQLKWQAAHGGVSLQKVLEVTGQKLPVNDTGIVEKPQKKYTH